MKTKIVILILILLSGFTIFNSCKDDDFPVPPASTVPNFTYIIDNDALAPANVTFTNTSVVPDEAGVATFNWNFGDGESSSEVNPTHLYNEPGAYNVSLVVKTSVSLEIKEKSATIVIKDPNASGTPIYYTDGSLVYSGLINSQSPVFSTLSVPSLQSSYNIIVDTINDYLFFSDYDAGKIFRSQFDGSNYIEFRTGLSGPIGLAIDYETDQIYWSTDDGIQRADLSSGDVNQKEDFLTGLNDPDGIAIDYTNQTLYWINYNGGIGVINLDGTGQTEISATPEGGSIIVVDDRIIYDEWIESGDIRIKSANLDGSDVSTIATGLERVVYALAYDSNEQKLYWGDRTNNVILRSNIDGSETESWYIDGGVQPRGIAMGRKK